MRNIIQTILNSLNTIFNHLKLLFTLSLGVFIVLGSMYMPNPWILTLTETSNHLLNAARIADVGFPKEAISKLDISQEDIEKQPYQQMKNALIKLENKDSNIRYAYIYTDSEAAIYCIIVDSEPAKE